MYLPNEANLNISIFSTILDGKNLTNSYKIYWFYGILEEIRLGNKFFTFDKIINHMVAKSWYTLLEYKLNFGKMDKLEVAVKDLQNKYQIPTNISEKELISKLNKIDNKNLKDFHKYVPYRLLAPFYKEKLKGKKEAHRNKLIEEYSQESSNSIYRIEDKMIFINDNWFDYLKSNINVVEGWLLHKLIIFLQIRNPNIPNIPFKLTPPQKRNLTQIQKIWKQLISEKDIIDIYSHKKITSDISIDHFIPWSFVLHDQFWNLIPTTRSINSSKSNSLPCLDEYLDDFCEQQFELYTFLQEKKKNKLLEEYIILNLEGNITKKIFKEKLKGNIKPLFEIAKNQGFQSNWRYREYVD
jgi:hypothetical protein